MESFRLALSFLTIIPGGEREPAGKDVFVRSTKYFPLVGLIIGVIVATVYQIASYRLPDLVSSALAVLSLVVVTRALHLDGLADTCDGLVGGRDSKHALSIMKDSRVGSFGAAAIALAVMLKITLLASIASNLKIRAIILFPVIGRWVATVALSTQRYAKSEPGLGSLFMDSDGLNRVSIGISTIASSIITVISAIITVKWLAAITIPAAAIFMVVFMFMVNRKIGGLTGDIIGAMIELSEITVLIALAAV
ncbi:MAG: adenosylcobinamide-GDP ribazoletransferase [Firmicutes bacterium]|nr:adenosylcobinamide-GDP ribazoletransferase [Bacillota bacterium]